MLSFFLIKLMHKTSAEVFDPVKALFINTMIVGLKLKICCIRET
jgi:hypothetical protein